MIFYFVQHVLANWIRIRLSSRNAVHVCRNFSISRTLKHQIVASQKVRMMFDVSASIDYNKSHAGSMSGPNSLENNLVVHA